MSRTLLALVLCCAGANAWVGQAQAQEELSNQCSSIANDPTRRYCNLVVDAIAAAQPRAGLALTAGNPVPGASSTLGMRLGAIPRVSVAGRVTGVLLELPPIESVGSNDEIKALLPSLNADVTVGIFSGFSVLPTVGGFGSLDLIGSIGTIPIPDDEGFADESPTSWAVGARLGILRESFTAPGVSVTGMYRRLSDLRFGDETLSDPNDDAYFSATSNSVLSVRGVVGKRLFVVGVNAGLGYDRYSSDIRFGVRNESVVGPSRFDFTEDGFDSSRTTAFGNLTWSMIILHIVGEVGWQSGGDTFTATLPSGQQSRSEDSALYGSFALRLSL